MFIKRKNKYEKVFEILDREIKKADHNLTLSINADYEYVRDPIAREELELLQSDRVSRSYEKLQLLYHLRRIFKKELAE